jgi:hypothetical protein
LLSPAPLFPSVTVSRKYFFLSQDKNCFLSAHA